MLLAFRASSENPECGFIHGVFVGMAQVVLSHVMGSRLVCQHSAEDKKFTPVRVCLSD